MLLVKVYSYINKFNEGKYSSNKKPKIWSWPVIIAIPVNNKIVPPTLFTIDIYFLKLFEKTKNLSIKIPDTINGIANPAEYEIRSRMLLFTFSSIAAKVKIDPSIGPMHGVHPNPNAAPTRNGKAKLLLHLSVKNLMSLFNNFKLINPSSCKEKNIIIVPAIILKISELDRKNWPRSEAVDPKTIKTKEKPKVKKTVFKIINFFLISPNLL